MRSLLFAQILLVVAACAARVTCQVAWSSLPSPVVGNLAYDSYRDVVVALTGTSTEEFDGVTWRTVPSTSFPGNGSKIVAYDSNRQRVVLIDHSAGWTWEWDGIAWQQIALAPVVPPYSDFGLIAYNESRQRVMFLKPGSSNSSGIELHEWNGAAWMFVPTANAPATGPNPWSDYAYHALAFDMRLQKLVLFGRSEFLGASVVRDALTWEWDAASGWVQFPASGVIGNGTEMWFDQHRGQVLRYDGGVNAITPHYVSVRQSSGAWAAMPFTGSPFMVSGCYDSRRSRFYSSWIGVGYFSDTYPATYTAHGSSCPVPNPPTLDLTAPWTRAWAGSTMSVEVGSLPQSLAILAMGFTDQSYGATPLPLDLGSYGMPQCHLRVAPEATLLVAGSSGAATFQIPVPLVPNVVGVRFWQQAFAPAPGANPAGMLASNSMQGLVGRSQ